MPLLTRPKIVCLLSARVDETRGGGVKSIQAPKKGVGAREIKNCDPANVNDEPARRAPHSYGVPFVLGPEFAIASMPAPTKRSSG